MDAATEINGPAPATMPHVSGGTSIRSKSPLIGGLATAGPADTTNSANSPVSSTAKNLLITIPPSS